MVELHFPVTSSPKLLDISPIPRTKLPQTGTTLLHLTGAPVSTIWGEASWLPFSIYLYLDFHLFHLWKKWAGRSATPQHNLERACHEHSNSIFRLLNLSAGFLFFPSLVPLLDGSAYEFRQVGSIVSGQNICGHKWHFGPFCNRIFILPSPYSTETWALSDLAKLAVVFIGQFFPEGSTYVDILGLRFIL